jgi:hypothetical protein
VADRDGDQEFWSEQTGGDSSGWDEAGPAPDDRVEPGWRLDELGPHEDPEPPGHCGHCHPTTRLVTLADGTLARCQECHPLRGSPLVTSTYAHDPDRAGPGPDTYARGLAECREILASRRHGPALRGEVQGRERTPAGLHGEALARWQSAEFKRSGGPVLTARLPPDGHPWDEPLDSAAEEPPGWLDPGGPGPESLDPASYGNPDRSEAEVEF